MKAQIICQMHVMVGRFCFFDGNLFFWISRWAFCVYGIRMFWKIWEYILTIPTSKISHQSSEEVRCHHDFTPAVNSLTQLRRVAEASSTSDFSAKLQAVLVLGLLNTLRFPMNILAAPWRRFLEHEQDDVEPVRRNLWGNMTYLCQVCEFQSLLI